MTKQQRLGWIYLIAAVVLMALSFLAGRRAKAKYIAVEEVETERLVCGVSRAGISCVPKIPGLFDEGSSR